MGLIRAGILGHGPATWAAVPGFRSPQPPAIQGVPYFRWLFWLAVFFGLLPGVMAYVVWAERKVAARFQDRIGPLGLLQSIADAVKLITKEDLVPASADRLVHLMAPVLLLEAEIQGDAATTVRWAWRIPAALASLGFLAAIVAGIKGKRGLGAREPWPERTVRPAIGPGAAFLKGTPRARAINDMGRYALPFEVAGLRLTAALVGSIALATQDGDDDEPADRAGVARRGRAARVDRRGLSGASRLPGDPTVPLSPTLPHEGEGGQI